MADAPLRPAQLDRLEDALEDLERSGSLERWLEDEPSPQVRERLTDYRSILAASREAMPLEEVPAGLLDGVIAEAHKAATVAPPMVAAESFWARLRRSFMVPALALAGTAALVLWIGRPQDADMNQEVASRSPSASAKSADKRTRTVKLSFDEELPEDAKPKEAAAAAEPAAAPPATVEGEAKPESGKDLDIVQPTEIPSLDPLGDAPDEKKDKGGEAPAPTDAKPAGPASGRWDIISRGDRARQAGDCITAREEYAVALEDDEARVRARALAGLGLCDRQNGDTPAADANFDRARGLDAQIDDFIDSQLRSPAPKRGGAKRKKKKRKPKKIDMQEQVMDPFG